MPGSNSGERSSLRFIRKETVAAGVDPLWMDDLWREMRRDAGFRYSSPSWTEIELDEGLTIWNRLGFYRSHVTSVQRVHGRMNQSILVADTAGLPLWALPAATAVIPALWATSELWRRRSRRKLGLCIQCGYDLRASAGRCPECGAVPNAPPTPA